MTEMSLEELMAGVNRHLEPRESDPQDDVDPEDQPTEPPATP